MTDQDLDLNTGNVFVRWRLETGVCPENDLRTERVGQNDIKFCKIDGDSPRLETSLKIFTQPERDNPPIAVDQPMQLVLPVINHLDFNLLAPTEINGGAGMMFHHIRDFIMLTSQVHVEELGIPLLIQPRTLSAVINRRIIPALPALPDWTFVTALV